MTDILTFSQYQTADFSGVYIRPKKMSQLDWTNRQSSCICGREGMCRK